MDAVKDVLIAAIGKLNEITNSLQLLGLILILVVLLVIALVWVLKKQKGPLWFILVFAAVVIFVVTCTACATAIIDAWGNSQAASLERQLEQTPEASVLLQPLEPEPRGEGLLERASRAPILPDVILDQLALVQERAPFFEKASVGAFSKAVAYAGRNAFLRDENVEAADLLRRAAALDPAPDRWNDLGVEAYERGDLRQAEAHYRKALELDEDYPNAFNGLGLIAYERGRRSGAVEKGMSQAIALFDQALAKLPGYGKAFNNRALAKLELGKASRVEQEKLEYYDQALADFKRAQELLPEEALITHNIGLVYELKGETDEAVSFYRKAIERNPRNVKSMNNLAMIHLHSPSHLDAAEALRLAERVVEYRPDDPGYLDTLARAQYQNGRKKEALATASQALASARELQKPYVSEIEAFVRRLESELQER